MKKDKETKTKDITVVQKSISPIIKQAEELVITNPEELKASVEILTTLNQWNDQVTEDKEKLTKPLNATLKEIRGRYKPIEVELETAIDSVRGKMSTYQTKALKERQEAEAAIAERVGEGKGHLKIETAVKQIEGLDPVDNRVVGIDDGAVAFVEVKKFEVTDLALLPIEYHLADEGKIRFVMKEGMELPGVKYWTEQSPRNFR